MAVFSGAPLSGSTNGRPIPGVAGAPPGKPIHTVIGGTHLGFASPDQLRQTIATLRERQVRRLGLSHCTGHQAGARLAAEFGDAVAFCNVGYSLTLD